MAVEGIPISGSILIGSGSPVEGKYLKAGGVPFNSVLEANSLIPITMRHIGLVVNVNKVEYCYRDDITDSSLVLKNTLGVEFTQSEKDKLSSLESSKFLGTYLTIESLSAQSFRAVAGSYGDVDSGSGNNVKRYIWDTTDATFVEQGSSVAGETTETIKAKYEADADVNRYSNEEKQKVTNARTHTEDSSIHVTATEKATWNNKVDKIAGKELSTNDFDNYYQGIVQGIVAQTFTGNIIPLDKQRTSYQTDSAKNFTNYIINVNVVLGSSALIWNNSTTKPSLSLGTGVDNVSEIIEKKGDTWSLNVNHDIIVEVEQSEIAEKHRVTYYFIER